jgi:hypothetical protein
MPVLLVAGPHLDARSRASARLLALVDIVEVDVTGEPLLTTLGTSAGWAASPWSAAGSVRWVEADPLAARPTSRHTTDPGLDQHDAGVVRDGRLDVLTVKVRPRADRPRRRAVHPQRDVPPVVGDLELTGGPELPRDQGLSTSPTPSSPEASPHRRWRSWRAGAPSTSPLHPPKPTWTRADGRAIGRGFWQYLEEQALPHTDLTSLHGGVAGPRPLIQHRQKETGVASRRTPAACEAESAAAHPTAVLAIICVSYFMVILDNSITFTALPLHPHPHGAQRHRSGLGAGRLRPGLRGPAAARRPLGRPAGPAPDVPAQPGAVRPGLLPRRCRPDRMVADHGSRPAGRGRRRAGADVAGPGHRQLPRRARALPSRRRVRRRGRHRRERRPGGRRRRGRLDLLASRLLPERPPRSGNGGRQRALPVRDPTQARTLRRRRHPHRHPRHGRPRLRHHRHRKGRLVERPDLACR